MDLSSLKDFFDSLNSGTRTLEFHGLTIARFSGCIFNLSNTAFKLPLPCRAIVVSMAQARVRNENYRVQIIRILPALY